MSRKGWLILGYAAVAIAGVIVYRKYKDYQRAKAHPIVLQPDSQLLQPVKVDQSLVTDAVVLNS